MQDPNQGEPNVVSPAPQEGTQPQEPAGQAAGVTQKPDPAAPQGTPISEDEKARRAAQSQYNKEVAAKLQAEQRANEMAAQLQQMQQLVSGLQKPQAEQTNPHNYQEDFPAWYRWEQESLRTSIVSEVSGKTQENFSNMVRQAQDLTWQQNHPDVDVGLVKQFQQSRGIPDIEDAYKLMTFESQLHAATAQGRADMLTQVTQPQTASPLSGQGGGGVPQGQAFAPLLEAYARDSSIENTWTPEVRAAFHAELNLRDRARLETGGG